MNSVKSVDNINYMKNNFNYLQKNCYVNVFKAIDRNLSLSILLNLK